MYLLLKFDSPTLHDLFSLPSNIENPRTFAATYEPKFIFSNYYITAIVHNIII